MDFFHCLIREKGGSILFEMNMQKKAGLIIGVIVIAIVLAVFFLMQSMKSPEQKSENSVANGLGEMTKGSIAGLIAAGKSVNCTMNYPDGQGSGSVYVSGKKVRGDFSVLAEGKEYKSSMIQDGDYAYLWSDADKKGTKIKVSGLGSGSAPTGANSQSQAVNLDQQVDLKCSSEGVDASKFVVPSDVEFTDMSAMMEKVQQQSGQTPGSTSSPCDAITDPQAKASCVSAYSNSQ